MNAVRGGFILSRATKSRQRYGRASNDFGRSDSAMRQPTGFFSRGTFASEFNAKLTEAKVYIYGYASAYASIYNTYK